MLSRPPVSWPPTSGDILPPFHSPFSVSRNFLVSKAKCDWHIFPLLRAAITVFHLTISLWGSRSHYLGEKETSCSPPCSSTGLGPTELCIFTVLNCRSPSPFLYSFFFFFFLSFGRHQQMIPWCVVPWAWKNFSYLKTGRPAASYLCPQACQEKRLQFFRPEGKSGHRMGALAVNSPSPGRLCFLDSLVFLDQLICLSGEEKRKQKQISHTSEELSWNPRRIFWQWSS